MDATITDIETARELHKRNKRLYTRAQVWKPRPIPGFIDPGIGKEGVVRKIQQIEGGDYDGEWSYTLRFETPRGYIVQGYFEQELRFLNEEVNTS